MRKWCQNPQSPIKTHFFCLRVKLNQTEPTEQQTHTLSEIIHSCSTVTKTFHNSTEMFQSLFRDITSHLIFLHRCHHFLVLLEKCVSFFITFCWQSWTEFVFNLTASMDLHDKCEGLLFGGKDGLINFSHWLDFSQTNDFCLRSCNVMNLSVLSSRRRERPSVTVTASAAVSSPVSSVLTSSPHVLSLLSVHIPHLSCRCHRGSLRVRPDLLPPPHMLLISVKCCVHIL